MIKVTSPDGKVVTVHGAVLDEVHELEPVDSPDEIIVTYWVSCPYYDRPAIFEGWEVMSSEIGHGGQRLVTLESPDGWEVSRC